jgi:hypothetical protein
LATGTAEATPQRVVELGVQRGERTPWAKTVRTAQQILQVADALWTFLETPGIEPTNNAAERALRQSVIQRKISHGVQSRQGAICRSARVPRSGVIPPAPPPRRSRGGPRTSGGWPSGWRCKGWAGPFPWSEYHLNQTNHAQAPCCRA